MDIKERSARRQAMVRENRTHGELAETLNQVTVTLACECGAPPCRQLLDTKTEDYVAVRSHPGRFFVAPGCEIPDPETVVERKGFYLIAERPEAVHPTLDRYAQNSRSGRARPRTVLTRRGSKLRATLLGADTF